MTKFILLALMLLSLSTVSAISSTSCVETDGGMQPGIPGQIIFEINDGYGIINDYCRNSDTLHERFCVTGSSLPARGTDTFCQFGCFTTESGLGACISENGSVSPAGSLANVNAQQLPNDWTPGGSIQDNDFNDEPELLSLDCLDDECNSCSSQDCEIEDVPEFSTLAAIGAFAISSALFLVLRNRK